MTAPVESKDTAAAGEVPRWGPPRWLMILTHLVALTMGVCEAAFWGGRTGTYAFILAVLAATTGVNAIGKAKDLLK